MHNKSVITNTDDLNERQFVIPYIFYYQLTTCWLVQLGSPYFQFFCPDVLSLCMCFIYCDR